MGALIAVLDDEPDIVELVSVNLTNAGFTVHGFYDSAGFFRFINKKRPDLIILDLMLPDDDGIEITKRLKGRPSFPAYPLLSFRQRARNPIRSLAWSSALRTTSPSPSRLKSWRYG
jgi:DNA-binding response OmpR family regulator